MKHLGDITKINGAEIETVDVITGGSPCQDLSIAGKRAGLVGARSGLFMEQVRIVKEMREHDRKSGRTGDMVRPRFMVWENVPGAFSSNKGRDFAAVLEEIIRIAEPEAPDIEVPDKGWPTWGGYHDCMGGRWSVAWRVHDAQHWGVPQRRRRISEDIKRLVATVEKGSREHPRKTRQSVFLEQYPDADISDDGLPDVAPCQLCVGLIHGESTEDCENRGLCVECRREFWMQVVE